MPKTPEAPPMKRREQFVQTYQMAKKSDPRLGLFILLAFVVGAAIGFGIFYLLPGAGIIQWVLCGLGAVMFGILTALIVFTRRSQKAVYAQMEGRTGAAASALTTLRRGWQTEPMVAFTKQQDVVHRVVGPPGIVLVGEGDATRLRQLLINERRRHERVAADTPVHEIVVGNDDGQIPLSKLVRHVSKMKRQVQPADITDLRGRLRAIDAARPNIPLPKGPVPTSAKGMRGNLRGR